MTYNEVLEKAHDGAEAVNDAAKNLYEKAMDTAHDGAEVVNDAAKNLYEKALETAHYGAVAVNDAAKNLNEVAKEQWGNISREAVDNENLIIGVLCGVASILFVYGLCKVVSYLDKQTGRK